MAKIPTSSTRPQHTPVPAMPLERTLTYRLHLLHKLTDLESQRAYLAEAGLPLSDGRCLASIGAFEPLSVNDLAHRANLNKGQASRAAQSLVDQGLVLKQASPTDGRGVVLSLTEAGRSQWRRTMEVIERRNQAIFGALSESDQARLGELFDRLIEHARHQATPPDEADQSSVVNTVSTPV
ncbi:MarR family winged helix-turn-helix transcriptional regulator [Curvibacter gracilis]|uniref:MarR family winged helix-turn-helix transcriptional regulator n=1 Tax=Curvibacter gracilis TaxID=230310 RepID=UPI0004841411|nr:MarR family winged helix-turn-helix transcriptional regulator [Curvibacter gracilis]